MEKIIKYFCVKYNSIFDINMLAVVGGNLKVIKLDKWHWDDSGWTTAGTLVLEMIISFSILLSLVKWLDSIKSFLFRKNNGI